MNRYPDHLYIHWPFCSFKCHYCDFVAFEQHSEYQTSYHHALLKEIAGFAQQLPPQHPIKTIFLGGGTPSLYPLEWITELFATLRKHFSFQEIQEITIETNPADIDEEKLERWHEIGITRLSIGVQSLNDDVLLKLNRRQRASDVLRTMRIAPKYFDNISVDLILGLPGVTTEEWLATIQLAVTWPIKHISVYFLTIHEKTPLYFKVERGDVKLADDQSMVELYEKTAQMLEENGFEQYEISNFARAGHVSTHNQAYWNRRPYKGFGVGAASFDGQRRSVNTNNLTTYLTEAPHIPATQEILTPEQEQLELLMLGLRQKKGMALHRMVYFLSDCDVQSLQANIDELKSAGLIEIENDRVMLTRKGMALENEIVVRLLTL